MYDITYDLAEEKRLIDIGLLERVIGGNTSVTVEGLIFSTDRWSDFSILRYSPHRVPVLMAPPYNTDVLCFSLNDGIITAIDSFSGIFGLMQHVKQTTQYLNADDAAWYLHDYRTQIEPLLRLVLEGS